MVLLHGVGGSWDEVLIAVAAIGVLWVALRLARRKPADGDEASMSDSTNGDEEHADRSHPRA